MPWSRSDEQLRQLMAACEEIRLEFNDAQRQTAAFQRQLTDLETTAGPRIQEINGQHDNLYIEMVQAAQTSQERYQAEDYGQANAWSDRKDRLLALMAVLVAERRSLVAQLRSWRASTREWQDYRDALEQRYLVARRAVEDYRAELRASQRRVRGFAPGESNWEPSGSRPPYAGVWADSPGGPERIVSFKIGRDGTPREGHILIRSGDYINDHEGFDDYHDHYGPDFEVIRGALYYEDDYPEDYTKDEDDNDESM